MYGTAAAPSRTSGTSSPNRIAPSRNRATASSLAPLTAAPALPPARHGRAAQR
jgi:hypothetical protein